jgi:hypothetical protein
MRNSEDRRHEGQSEPRATRGRAGMARIAMVPIASVLLLLLPFQSGGAYAATYGAFDTY